MCCPSACAGARVRGGRRVLRRLSSWAPGDRARGVARAAGWGTHCRPHVSGSPPPRFCGPGTSRPCSRPSRSASTRSRARASMRRSCCPSMRLVASLTPAQFLEETLIGRLGGSGHGGWRELSVWAQARRRCRVRAGTSWVSATVCSSPCPIHSMTESAFRQRAFARPCRLGSSTWPIGCSGRRNRGGTVRRRRARARSRVSDCERRRARAKAAAARRRVSHHRAA